MRTWQAGSNRSGDLADAQKSIPVGTLCATLGTAADVKWTYEQCADPKNANIMAGRIGDLLECVVNGCDVNRH